MDLTLFISSVFTLTLVMDPLGNMPPFVTALKGVPAERRRAVVFVSWLINMAILAGFSERIPNFMGARGLLAMEKLMGMILVTISVQMIMTGLKKFMAG